MAPSLIQVTSVAGEFVEVQVRVKCLVELARWKLVTVGAAVYTKKEDHSQKYEYRRDWLIGACAYRLQQQENMRLLYVCAY